MQPGQVDFHCLYTTETSESDPSDVAMPGGGIGQIQSWQNFELSFGRERLSIGDRIFALVKWNTELSLTDIVWYVDRCTVISGENSYDVIQKSCYSDLVSTAISSEISSEIYSKSNFAFSFESFSFKNPTRQDVTKQMTFRLDCNIRFCLEKEKCRVNTDCPKYYYSPLL